MKIVTGYTGSPHVTSNDEQGKNQGIFGAGNCVLNVGNRFNATLTNANTVTIEDGEGIMQGVHFRIEPGTTETVNIQNGTSGYNRYDLICARYTKNAVTGVEAVNLVVITGTPDASSPTIPSYTQGDILGGDMLAEFPLWSVYVNGLVPTLIKRFDLWKKPLTFYTSSQAVSIPALDNHTINFDIPLGTWIIQIKFSFTFTSGSITGGGEDIQLYSSCDIEQHISVFPRQTDAYGYCMGFYTKDAERQEEIVFTNRTGATARLDQINVTAVQLA